MERLKFIRAIHHSTSAQRNRSQKWRREWGLRGGSPGHAREGSGSTGGGGGGKVPPREEAAHLRVAAPAASLRSAPRLSGSGGLLGSAAFALSSRIAAGAFNFPRQLLWCLCAWPRGRFACARIPKGLTDDGQLTLSSHVHH